MSNISIEEQNRRAGLAARARRLFCDCFAITSADETSITINYFGFYVQVSFSALHPLVMFCFAGTLRETGTDAQLKALNELNLQSVLGTHTVNPEAGCYAYRAVHWLDPELTRERLFELLGRFAGEAQRGYDRLRL